MKKVASSSTYSEFRKKNLAKELNSNGNSSILQIEQLSKQLESFALKNKKANIQSKFNKPHNVIEEVDEEDFSYATLNKTNKNSEQKLTKILANKEPKMNNPTKKKFNEPNKLNKSLDNSLSAKFLKQGIVAEKQRASISGKGTQKSKDSSFSGRRMSLTGGLTSRKRQVESETGTSTNKDEQFADETQVKQIRGKLSRIQEKIKQQKIPDHKMEQMNEKLDSILQILSRVE